MIRLRPSWLAIALIAATLLTSASAEGARKHRRKKHKAAPAEKAPAKLAAPAPAVEAAKPVAPRRPNESGRPWGLGVAEEDQQAAWALFLEGNSFLKDAAFPKAVDKYRAALQHWDHPAIHYNLALALPNTDEPVEVLEHLDKAVAYGMDPLGPKNYERAKSHQALMRAQLAFINIKVDEPGAVVSLDGQTLFVAPGKWSGRARPGPHTILASKEGHLTSETTKIFAGGTSESFELTLIKQENGLTASKRVLPVWQPWAIAGSGAAFLIAGGVLHWQATSTFSDYDDGILACSNAVGGAACDPSSDLASKKDRGELYRAMAIVSYGVGAAALVTGATLIYMNREHRYQSNPVERESVSVVPVVGPGVGGVQATFSF